MPKITRDDWVALRDEYHVAFTRMKRDLFELFLKKIYGNPGSGSSAPDKVDETDAMMIYLARGEPPIQPVD